MKQLYSLVLVVWVVAYLKHYCVHGKPEVPCYFIFGDSLVDAGNNNHLATSARADYRPYGIDFPEGRATGRFCNGRTTADIIGELLGFETFVPSFQTAKRSEILKGVNYASGSAGIRDETGKHMGTNMDLNTQLHNHGNIISRIVDILGNKDSATKHLNKCLYSFVIGSNDYINNYFIPTLYNTSKQYTPKQYAKVLIQQYSQQLKSLYNLGARMVALSGIGQIGCTPHAIQEYGKNSTLCVDYMNNAARDFNKQLKSLVNQLNKELKDAKFLSLSTDGTTMPQLIASPGNDFQSIDFFKSCCKVNEDGLCIRDKKPCSARNLHTFWDAFHPTEMVNQLTARTSYPALKTLIKDIPSIRDVTDGSPRASDHQLPWESTPRYTYI